MTATAHPAFLRRPLLGCLAIPGLLALVTGCQPSFDVPCVDGRAAGFACDNVGIAAHLPTSELGARRMSDLWGWTDPASGAELVLAGATTGLAVVDATTASSPELLGFLPSRVVANAWRDIEVVDGFAYVVSDYAEHGMQIIELPPLVGNASEELSEDGHYAGFGACHNVASIPDKRLVWGLATDTCNQGMHGVDVSDPLSPEFLGCWEDAGYVHDAHCVTYQGPDADHAGKDICVAFTPEAPDDHVWIVDMSDPRSPSVIGKTTYPSEVYSHQGWLTEDHSFLLMNDEFDEEAGFDTRTMFFDLHDLDAPKYVGAFLDDTKVIGHDAYIVGDRLFQADYAAGLRIFDITDAASADLTLVGHFDTHPPNDGTNYAGAWGVYPFFPSGTVAVTSQAEGLFLLKPRLP